ncbi:hypothetical protein DYB32_008224, partial [Aphanomyces invadans]
MRWRTALILAGVASATQNDTGATLVQTILDTEIQETEALLGLYRQQAAAFATVLQRKMPTFESNTDTTASIGLKAWQPMEAPLADPLHGLDTALVDKASHMFGPDVVAFQLLSWRVHVAGRRRKLVDTDIETIDFLAVARSDGLLELRNPRTFGLVWQIQTRVESITSIHQQTGTRSIVAVVSCHGDVTVFAVRVFEHGRLRVGDPPRDQPTDRAVCLIEAVAATPKTFQWGRPLPKVTSVPAPVGLHVDVFRLYQTPRSRSFAKVLLVQVSYDIFVVVATDLGDVSIFGHGGHCVHHMSLQQPVVALASVLGGSIAFAMGTTVGVLNIPQWDYPVQVCSGSAHPLISLERDVHRPSILYAGTSGGTVLVLQLHRSFSQRRHPHAPCSIQNQLVPWDAVGPVSMRSHAMTVQLGSLPRLLFIVANHTFAGYQLVDTHVAKRMFAVDWRAHHNSTRTTLLVMKDKPHDALVMLSSRLDNGSTFVVAHESLMRHDALHYDVTWVRAPLM